MPRGYCQSKAATPSTSRFRQTRSLGLFLRSGSSIGLVDYAQPQRPANLSVGCFTHSLASTGSTLRAPALGSLDAWPHQYSYHRRLPAHHPISCGHGISRSIPRIARCRRTGKCAGSLPHGLRPTHWPGDQQTDPARPFQTACLSRCRTWTR